MTDDEWAEYRRRVVLRDQRRRLIRKQVGWSDIPGRGVPHRVRHMNDSGPLVNAPIARPPSGGWDRRRP